MSFSFVLRLRFFILTEIIWYEFDIMAISMLSSTMMLITEYDPNMRRAQKRVKLLIPCSSNAMRSTRPKPAQNRDCDVSNRLKTDMAVMNKELDAGG